MKKVFFCLLAIVVPLMIFINLFRFVQNPTHFDMYGFSDLINTTNSFPVRANELIITFGELVADFKTTGNIFDIPQLLGVIIEFPIAAITSWLELCMWVLDILWVH